jgi:hypothetical protein
VRNNIIRVTLERAAGELPVHPRVERMRRARVLRALAPERRSICGEVHPFSSIRSPSARLGPASCG